MTKVMTRTKRNPGTRPPSRHDTRRPAGTTPRTTPGRETPGSSSRGENTGSATGTGPGGSTASTSRTMPGGNSPRTAGPRHRAPARSPLRTPPQPRPTDLFADLLLAVLSGQRPVHSMLRHTAGRAYDELAWLAERGPLRTRGTRPVVRDVGYEVPRPGAIEAFARIGAGDQLRAMAFRLEKGHDLRWRCTAVELGGARMPRTDDN
ncbi:Rv3235 family protein [Streptomyces vastus]|uniref:Rv3235 family protein n=1 Tax=Streptomyces vastus TaxID=285451 RepID=UPI0031D6388C